MCIYLLIYLRPFSNDIVIDAHIHCIYAVRMAPMKNEYNSRWIVGKQQSPIEEQQQQQMNARNRDFRCTGKWWKKRNNNNNEVFLATATIMMGEIVYARIRASSGMRMNVSVMAKKIEENTNYPADPRTREHRVHSPNGPEIEFFPIRRVFIELCDWLYCDRQTIEIEPNETKERNDSKCWTERIGNVMPFTIIILWKETDKFTDCVFDLVVDYTAVFVYVARRLAEARWRSARALRPKNESPQGQRFGSVSFLFLNLL